MSDTRSAPPNPERHGLDLGITPRDCGDFGIRIGQDGTWYYLESPIRRLPLVKLFASVLQCKNGEYWLITPAERGRITVDDAPFVAVALSIERTDREQILHFRTNLDDDVTVDRDHPLTIKTLANGEPRPYVEIRNGLRALIARAVYYDLIELATTEVVEHQERVGVWSAGTFFPLD